jgi:glycosyltransferase involved in cell wall biosynthesis
MALSPNLKNKILIRSATPDEMPELLISHTASAMFFNSDISKLGSSPTRFGEILAVGRPIICNKGVGDLDKIVEDNNVGIIANNPNYEFMMNSVSKLYKILEDPSISLRCRSLAESYYSLSKGIENYSKIYEMLKK